MYLTKNLAKIMPKIDARIPESRIVIMIRTISWRVIVCKMSLIASAVPERAFPIA